MYGNVCLSVCLFGLKLSRACSSLRPSAMSTSTRHISNECHCFILCHTFGATLDYFALFQ